MVLVLTHPLCLPPQPQALFRCAGPAQPFSHHIAAAAAALIMETAEAPPPPPPPPPPPTTSTTSDSPPPTPPPAPTAAAAAAPAAPSSSGGWFSLESLSSDLGKALESAREHVAKAAEDATPVLSSAVDVVKQQAAKLKEVRPISLALPVSTPPTHSRPHTGRRARRARAAAGGRAGHARDRGGARAGQGLVLCCRSLHGQRLAAALGGGGREHVHPVAGR